MALIYRLDQVIGMLREECAQSGTTGFEVGGNHTVSRGALMPTPRKPDWADKIASKRWATNIVRKIYATSLRAEHRRAVRAVQRVAGAVIEDSMDADQYDAYMAACEDILKALQKGRT